MTRTSIKVECTYVTGKPQYTVKTAHGVTSKFVDHVRARIIEPFSITYNAGSDEDFSFDLCKLAGVPEGIVESFNAP